MLNVEQQLNNFLARMSIQHSTLDQMYDDTGSQVDSTNLTDKTRAVPSS